MVAYTYEKHSHERVFSCGRRNVLKEETGLAFPRASAYIQSMRFGDNFLEELKARIRPSDVVGRHVKLKRQGREFAGLSPFTSEKTPSFFVNDEKGFYHCFSSGKHGDAISFLMEVEGLAFPEAVERLAEMAGMEMPKADPQAEQRAARNKVAINWMDAAQLFFARSLRRDAGRAARDYLKRRGLDGEAAERFGIGFAPDSFNALRDELVQQGASLDVLVEAGLVITPDDTSREPWDRFRNRIMFPIKDPRGRLVAFGGRAMEKDAKAKYLNSPETSLFHKGRVLYHYPEARKALSAPKNGARGMIVAEGYMDVIALARAGFDHAVAPLGTALTEDQLDLLWRAGPEPILCFDGDKAGLRAAFRSVERALPLIKPGQTLRFALMPEGKDPDDLIRESGSPAMQSILERAVSMVDMLWQREVEAEPLTSPEARAGLKDRLFTAMREITHDEVRKQYQTALLARFDSEFGRQFGKKRSGGYQSRDKPRFVNPALKQGMLPDAMQASVERRVMGGILAFPEMLDHVDQTFFALNFKAGGLKRLQTAILSYYRETKAVEKSSMLAHIEAEGLDQILRELHRERRLNIAAMGGSDATLDEKLALWQADADALTGPTQDERAREDTRSRLADTIREDNADGLQRLMRASRTIRD